MISSCLKDDSWIMQDRGLCACLLSLSLSCVSAIMSGNQNLSSRSTYCRTFHRHPGTCRNGCSLLKYTWEIVKGDNPEDSLFYKVPESDETCDSAYYGQTSRDFETLLHEQRTCLRIDIHAELFVTGPRDPPIIIQSG